ncbi:two-component regulator propeller domain-containing protein [Aestuariivivens sediminis]|uniref:two-component regulator propeller domain-containing protein n=1 Tax=Aestuariivivens sediminis TaxID=2913557 RepID=UPI001F569639|nr:two-component regulator propeller domain-containing protein [Aestuariivivens sediminis]
MTASFKYIIVAGLCMVSFVGKSQSVDFKKLSINEGLPHSDVTSIVQDSLGFMWFGTYNGLCRFDGYETKVFRYSQDDNNSISNNRILSLLSDSSNNLWIGTELGGLNKLNLTTQQLQRMRYDSLDDNSISSNQVTAIFEDSNGTIWVGTNKGLNELKNDAFKHYLNPNTLVNTIISDGKDVLWIGTGEGLIYFNTRTKSHLFYGSVQYGTVNAILQDRLHPNILYLGMGSGLYQFDKLTKTFTRMRSEEVLSVSYDHRSNIWYGTRNNGVFKLSTTGEVEHYQKNKMLAQSLSNNEVSSLYEDYSGVLWVGTLGGGVNQYNTRQKKFKLYKIRPDQENTISSDVIICFNETNDHKLWIGTRGGGLNVLDRDTGKFHVFDSFRSDNDLDCNNISALYHDDKNNLLVGAWGGLFLLDPAAQKNIITKKQPAYIDLLSKWDIEPVSIFKIAMDSDGHVWLCTHHGLIEFIPDEIGSYEKGVIKRYRQSDAYESISDDRITDIMIEHIEHDTKLIWVGSRNGLNRMIVKNDTLTSLHKIYHDPKKRNGLRANYISFLHKDSSGHFWVGTLGGGLNRMTSGRSSTENEFTFEAYTQNNGLVNNDVEGLLEDSKGNLWLSGEGITKFNYQNNTFRHYTVEDGLQSNSFKIWAAFKNDNGELIFGGINGFNMFNPDSIVDNPIPPKVCITELKIFNNDVEPYEKISNEVILSKTISHTGRIALKHSLNNFTLGFSALHYTSPQSNKFKYKLEGADEDWTMASGDKRSISYANLNTGDYTLKVMAANSDGIWGKPISMDINICPPWWLSKFAYAVYALMIIGLLLLFRKYSLIRVQEKNRLQLEGVLRKQEEEVNQIKLRFFTDISHEIRTPLSLIVGPIKELVAESNIGMKVRKKIALAHRNINMLMRLTDEIMDFSKYEKGQMGLHAAKGDLVSFINEITLFFEHIALRRKITYSFSSNEKEIWVWHDRNKLEKVIFNLLNNAFKFTPDEGEISVQCTKNEEERTVEVAVYNSGIGIPDHEISHIFERYYQIDNHTKHTGSGIGLSLSKFIIEQHKGKIWAESEMDKYAVFKFTLLLGKDHLGEHEMVSKHFESERPEYYHPQQQLVLQEDQVFIGEDGGKSNILVVEDNDDLRRYIKDNLSKYFNIYEANNGEEALNITSKRTFDLIISDVMMPKMDGIMLCRKLKTSINTSHIPIILLTARTSLIYKLDGYSTGADDYITKPFNIELLVVRTNNLINSRKKLRENFKKDYLTEPQHVTVTSLDEKILQKCLDSIENNMSNTEFSVEELCMDVGLSRSQLYRKIKALTNLSINNFIKTVRLKRAAQILGQDNSSVVDVMDSVGFSNSSYFTRSFKSEFGCTPKTYRAKFSKSKK